jgi:electron transfer flavoprotein beta subunit
VRIAVILRNAPDPLEELPFIEGAIDWQDAAFSLNIFDDFALEEAVLLKEQTGAELVAVALALDGDRLLQTAVARGASRAVKLDADVAEETSSRALAPVFAEAVRQIGADLVLTGVQAPGDVFGQLGPFLAHHLGWAQTNGAVGVQVSAGRISVRHDQGAGRGLLLSLEPPAVIGIQASRRPPSYVSGTRLRKAIETAAIEKLPIVSELAQQSTQIVALRRPEKDRSVELLDEDPEVAAGQIVKLLSTGGVAGRTDA